MQLVVSRESRTKERNGDKERYLTRRRSADHARWMRLYHRAKDFDTRFQLLDSNLDDPLSILARFAPSSPPSSQHLRLLLVSFTHASTIPVFLPHPAFYTLKYHSTL
jgi:hypothetical protein